VPTVRQHQLFNGLPAFERFRQREKTSFGSRAAQCDGKRSFECFKLAAEAAKRRSGREAYRCRYCRLWHVGTRG
jgi:hypothetical protein